MLLMPALLWFSIVVVVVILLFVACGVGFISPHSLAQVFVGFLLLATSRVFV